MHGEHPQMLSVYKWPGRGIMPSIWRGVSLVRSHVHARVSEAAPLLRKAGPTCLATCQLGDLGNSSNR